MTNEDGTGKINLNMTWQEIAAVLDEKGIPYEVMGSWTEDDAKYSKDDRFIFAADGTDYSPASGYFTVQQTKKGLMPRDPLSRVIELYGEPDKTEKNLLYDNIVMYYYILINTSQRKRT